MEIPSGREADAALSGSVTYRERIALTPGAKLIVSLYDVALQDTAAPLIARQTIENPGQVPIAFRVEYSREDINSRNTYAIQARIVESDGRLAFTNGTAYEVITGGNPSKVDMLLILVEPPPDQVEEGQDWRTWVEAPAPVIWANLLPNEPEHFLQVAYYQSTIEGCARPGSEELRVEGTDIIATVTLMQPPTTKWAIPCQEQVVEFDTVLPILAALHSEQAYRIIVNDRVMSTISLPRPDFPASALRESPIEHAALEVLGSDPQAYQLRVVSGMPSSSCSHFNGYEIRRDNSNAIDVRITHHRVVEKDIACTANDPIIETVVPLGSDFEKGLEYTVSINGENSQSFIAR
ncbi:MAG: YbaY family lipoprotein [Chloroflexota bacterium]|nr:YbaY family lipoprotein [Chloroflexota bacterium]MDE2930528.1 YbaY family lipoprotein [Chloroflexota bacterium]